METNVKHNTTFTFLSLDLKYTNRFSFVHRRWRKRNDFKSHFILDYFPLAFLLSCSLKYTFRQFKYGAISITVLLFFVKDKNTPVSLKVAFLLPLSVSVQFQQSVSSEVKCLGRTTYTLCVDSPLVIRQALHPEASKKVIISLHCSINWRHMESKI